MPFRVVWMKGPLPMGSKDFDDLSAATRHAEIELPEMQSRFGATAVKVVDDAGIPHFLKAISRA